MKATAILAFALIVFIAAIAVATSAAIVTINPSQPYDSDDLTCYVAGSAGDFDFYWYKNGVEYKTEFGSQSVIDSSETASGEIWKCKAFTPLGSKVGESEVQIDAPKYTGNVMITPDRPSDDNALKCNVTISSGPFDFYWLKNNQQYKVDFGSETFINSDETGFGDTFTCQVFTPLGSKVGEASVGIDANIVGTVILTPANPTTLNDLTAYVQGNSASFDYVWYKDGIEYSEDSGIQSVLSNTATTKNEVWTVMVYTPLYNNYIGEESVLIINSPPVISSISLPSTADEGANIGVSFSATDADNDDLFYWIELDGSKVSSSESYSWNAVAGTHTFAFYAFDGEDVTVDSRTITVSGTIIPGKKEVTIYNMRISSMQMPEGTFLKIRNEAHSVDGVTLNVYARELNSMETFNLDVERNRLKLIPLDFEFDSKNIYLLKIEIKSDDYTGSDYLIVET